MTTHPKKRPNRFDEQFPAPSWVNDSALLLSEVAQAARLAEGPEGVRHILRSVFRGEPIPLRDLARDVSLPVPVVAAVRGELESRRLLARGAGVVLTDSGRELVSEGLGIRWGARFRSVEPDALPDELQGLLDPMGRFCESRPRVDVTLDQSHATPETALRRAVYLLEMDALEGRDLLLLGDDDLTSLATALVAEYLHLKVNRIAVVECDARLVSFLDEAAKAFDVRMEIRQHDLRDPLPEDLLGSFDAFLTDPPYTVHGLSLFVSRGVSALRAGPSHPAALCFGHRTPDVTAEVMQHLAGMGLAPTEIIPGFNRYVGAQLLAGSSQMIRLATTSHAHPEVEERYEGALYTADRLRKAGGP